MTEDQKKIVEFLEGKKGKTKFYFNDFFDVFPERGPREVKKVLTSCVNAGILEFWSSGSTTMYGLTGAGKKGADGEI